MALNWAVLVFTTGFSSFTAFVMLEVAEKQVLVIFPLFDIEILIKYFVSEYESRQTILFPKTCT